MAHEVFISYSIKDKLTADAMSLALESKAVRCWIAPRDVLPGLSWGEAIIDAISESRIVVLIFSAHANESQQVMREVELAASKGIPILPFRIEDAPLSKGMEYFISGRHWLDASTPPVEQHLPKLSETIQTLISRIDEHRHPGSTSKPQDINLTEVRVLAEHSPSVGSVAFSPDGKTFASGGSDGIAALWSTQNWRKVTEVKRTGRVHSLVFSPDSTQLAILQANSRDVWLWGIQRGALEFNFDNASTANCLSFSPDGKSLAVGSRDHTARLWDMESETLTETLEHPYRVQSVSYSPDGRLLAVAGGYHEVRLWDLQTKQQVLAETDTNSSSAHKTMFSPDGQTLLTLRAEMRQAELCDTRTGKLVRTFRCPSKLQSSAFSADGKIVAGGAWDSKIYLWHAPTGQLIRYLDGHTNMVTCLAFSPTAECLASGSWDSTVRLWTKVS